MLPRVFWTIDGYPVEVQQDWSCNSSTNIGFDQMRGVIPAKTGLAFPSTVQQGSIVTGYAETGDVVWSGRLATIPRVQHDGTASISAQGHGYAASKQSRRLLFSTDSPLIWSDASLPPANRASATAVAADFNVSIQDTGITWNSPTGGWVAGSFASLQVWAPGTKFRRVTWPGQGTEPPLNQRYFGSASGLFFRLGVATGPSGPESVFYYTDNISTGISPTGTIDVTIDNPQDALVMTIGGSSVSNRGVYLNKIRVYGETVTDLCYSEQVAEVVADKLGWDTSGVANIGGTDVYPLDWDAAWDGLLSYLAAFEDACWGVFEDKGAGPILRYKGYERVWDVSSSTGAQWDMEPLELVNRVSVHYVTPAGQTGTYTLDADPDPLAASGLINEMRMDLNDDQADVGLASYAAYKQLRNVSTQKYRGRIQAMSVLDAKTGLDSPYEVRAGDLIRIRDFAPGEDLTCRIADVEYASDGIAIGVEQQALFFPKGYVAGTSSKPWSRPNEIPAWAFLDASDPNHPSNGAFFPKGGQPTFKPPGTWRPQRPDNNPKPGGKPHRPRPWGGWQWGGS